MGILDEAIREHLELKRQHGAGDNELRNLEDQAFGPPARPGEPAVAEQPEALESEAPTELAALQEVPEPAEPPPSVEEEAAEPDAQVEVPELEEAPAAPEGDPIALETEEHPPPEGAREPDLPDPVEEPPAPVVEQPTELYEPEDAGLPVEEPAAPDEGEPVEDEFFSEQSLSDELDQALDAPEGDEPLPPAEPAADVEEPLPPAEPEEVAADESEEGEDGEDVLEETPEFLQDTPESDRLWFEQRPPKDFDFDD
jgi:hypothetical protein